MSVDLHQLIKKALSWRYAVRKFDSSKKLSDKDFQLLLETLVMTPSSYGLQPWKFIVVENPEIRQKLKAASYNQPQVTDASHFLVIAAKEKITSEDVHKFIQRTADIRSISIDSLNGYRDVMLKSVVDGMRPENMLAWNQRQTYIALGFLLKTAALLNIDSAPMEGIVNADYDSILGLRGTGYNTVAGVALGYRHKDDPGQHAKKVRYDHDELVEYRK